MRPMTGDLAGAWALLEQAGWLARRSREVRELLKASARLRECADGEVLFRAGDVPNGVFGLVDGALEIAVPTMGGEEGLFHRAEPGFWVGDLALFAGQRRLVSIRAAGPSSVVHLAQDALNACVVRHPALTRDFYELSHENMQTALQLLGNLAVPSAESRIALRLLMHSKSLRHEQAPIRLSANELAQLVAVSPKTVRRALQHLQNLGLIETGYATIRVVDHDGLARQCGHGLER